ncbi:MAG TPA: hypothetical protein VEB65_00640 [Solirubrobacterales bacterium]|nr:hypothetical protein [Solirubrobacterales bacterium]
MLPFWLSIGALSLLQALLVALPRPARLPALERLRSGWWALWLPLPIAVVVAAIALDNASARFLTYLALVAVPPLAALALGAIVRGARPWWALLAVPLFALAWAVEGSFGGHTAATVLTALSCTSLGWLLACVVPVRWLKLGIYAMAAIDAYLVGTNLLQEPNGVLNAVAPAADLPKLQLVHFGSAVMGYGDVFIAATLGALLAAERRWQLRGALVAALVGCAFDLLFFAVDTLPATVPIAIALAILELWRRSESGDGERDEAADHRRRKDDPAVHH